MLRLGCGMRLTKLPESEDRVGNPHASCGIFGKPSKDCRIRGRIHSFKCLIGPTGENSEFASDKKITMFINVDTIDPGVAKTGVASRSLPAVSVEEQEPGRGTCPHDA